MGRISKMQGRGTSRFWPSVLRIGMLAFVAAFGMILAQPPAMAQVKAKPGARAYHIGPGEDRISMRVTLHKSETVKVDFPFTEALIGSPETADIVPLTNKSVYVLGKKIGVTRLSLLDANKQVLGIVDIEVSHDVDALRASLRDDPSFRRVRVNTVNGKILLLGMVPDAPSAARAAMLAEQIAPGDVTNALTVTSPQQVMLEVRFVEASRDAERGLGVNWLLQSKAGTRTHVAGATDYGSVTGGGTAVNLAASIAGSAATPFGSAIGRVLDGGIKADVIVKALEERGLARRLAEPNLVALSGQPANFLAGGEFPFPVSADNGKVTTAFKKFGIGLAFTPTVLNNGMISLIIEPEVSELDYTNGVKLDSGNGTTVTVPGLSVRRAQTTVELREGQSFAIAGLLANSHTSTEQQLPWIGDVPVLGALFRSASFQKKETDLVIIVTPRLVKPRIPGQRLATPFDRTVPGNDADVFLLGRQEVESTAARNEGHIIDYKPQGEVSSNLKDAR